MEIDSSIAGYSGGVGLKSANGDFMSAEFARQSTHMGGSYELGGNSAAWVEAVAFDWHLT